MNDNNSAQMPKLYGVDGGGTNIRIAEVNPQTLQIEGDVMKRSIADFHSSEQLSEYVKSVVPSGAHVGVDFAGTCDNESGIVTQSPNVVNIADQRITLVKDLRDSGYKSELCNDMVAAVQGEFHAGGGKDLDMILVATYSSGFNCAVMTKEGIPFSPEFGHQTYEPASRYFCGCGGRGHIEFFVTGTGSAKMAQDIIGVRGFSRGELISRALEAFNTDQRADGNRQYSAAEMSSKELRDQVLGHIDSKMVCAAYRAAPTGEPQKTVVNTQVAAIATSFERMFAAYHPMPRFVLMGSQTNDWDVLFEPAIAQFNDGVYNMGSMRKPEIVRTTMKENGIIGAAANLMRMRPDNYNPAA